MGLWCNANVGRVGLQLGAIIAARGTRWDERAESGGEEGSHRWSSRIGISRTPGVDQIDLGVECPS